VNDAAERTVALVSAYNNTLTKNEDELQDILQVVETHRVRFPNYKKSTFLNYQTLK
jgi:molybdopterin-guanine dinucleotide biosynthesis protein A